MSFSGLKSALRRERDLLIDRQGGLSRTDQDDLAASFQQAVADVLLEKTRRAAQRYIESCPESPALAVAGGVAANRLIRNGLQGLASSLGLAYCAPPPELCTDNAAMIAWAGHELTSIGAAPAAIAARPRWPLDQTQPALLGSGKKGAKA